MWRLILFLIAALLTGCREKTSGMNPGTTVSGGNESTNLRSFQVFGVVKELDADGKTVRIKHEEIPDYMAAMTMPFEVRNTNELRGLAPGDAVSFRLWVTKDDGWIDQIRKLESGQTNAPPIEPALPPGIQILPDVEPLAIGDELPDYHFTNQFGKNFSLKQFRGNALAITFIFTRCPFPLFCPRMTGGFAETQQKLSALPNAPTNWHLLSLTIDPDYDTPEILRGYGERNSCNPAHWTLATGTLADITTIGEQFGLVTQRDAPGALPNHNLRTIIVTPAGRIQNIIRENKWTSDDLVKEILTATRGE